MTTQLGRTETDSAALARSERRRQLQWWAQIEAAAGGSWPDVLAVLTAAVELQTDRFVVVQFKNDLNRHMHTGSQPYN